MEELVKNQVLELDGALDRLDERRVRELRTEGRQLMKVIRGVGYYLCLLTLIYLSHTIWLLNTLSLPNFRIEFKNEQYAEEIYQYAIAVEWIKIVHAISLVCIAIFIVSVGRGEQMLSERHYLQLLVLTIVITILYFCPLFYIFVFTYRDVGKSVYIENSTNKLREQSQAEWALGRFGEWLIMMLKDTDGGNEGLGWSGLVFTLCIHVQIYMLLLIMQWTTW